MGLVTDESFTTKRSFLSLKWKLFIVLSLVLVTVNASLAYLVFRKTTGQFESEQLERRMVQVRELKVVLSKELESISTFSSFIPLLSTPAISNGTTHPRELLSAVLSEHGLMLAVEWGVEGVHYFSFDHLQAPLVSWPAGRVIPLVADLLDRVRRDEIPQGHLSCENSCYQVVTLPLLQKGETAGYLIVERSIADSLREFYLLSGADLALLSAGAENGGSEARKLASWGRDVPVITHEDSVLPILQGLSQRVSLHQVLGQAQRIQFQSEWYEVFAVPAVPGQSDLILLMVNRVTQQVQAIRDATKDSLILGLAGLVLSELTLLLLMWGPMQRIQDVVYALPLLAEKSFVSLRDELPSVPSDSGPRDEIDLVVEAIREVSAQIESLDGARTAAEQALRKSEQSLQLAQSMAKVASWVGYPLEGDFEFGQGAGRIDTALERVRDWQGLLALVHPDDRSRLKIAWHRGRGGSRMDVEFRLIVSEHKFIDVHAMADFGIFGARRVLRATGMMQDITEMRAVQRALQGHRDRLEKEVAERTAELSDARNRAEELARTKSDFLANMSHEIRTPMSAVLGLSQIGMRQSHNRKIAQTFEQILEAGGHLLNVVNDILDVSKLEAGTLATESVPFQVRKVVSTCAEMLRPRAEAKSLQMRVCVAEDFPDWVLGDSFRVQQILINLMSNAVKFTERGSIFLDVYRESEISCFKVRDTGIGMSAEQLRRLFTPFHQFENSLTRNHEGTGLGLSISNTLAGLMGGGIRVLSKPGVGSEFILRLPMPMGLGTPSVGEVSGRPDVSDGQLLAGIRVLVADDVRINRTIVEALLEAEGATVTTAANGMEAVEVVLGRGKGAFDVILMDLEMPKMNGRQATRRIRVSQPALPIIGLTAHVSEEEREKSLESGMDDQLVKPVLPETLVAAILRLRPEGSACKLHEGGRVTCIR